VINESVLTGSMAGSPHSGRSRRPAAWSVLIWGAWGALIASPAHPAPAVADRLAAVVNDELITVSEVEAARHAPAVDLLGEVLPSLHPARTGLLTFGTAMETLIDQRLLLQERPARRPEHHRRRAAAALATLAAPQRLVDDAALRLRLQDQLTIIKLVNREVRSKLLISAEDLESYYRAHRTRSLPARVRIRQIFLKAPEGADPAGRETRRADAEALGAELSRGAEFATLARERSDGAEAVKGGDLGYFHPGELLPAIDRAIETLAEGETSPVIATPLGFHIVKLEERQAGRLKPFAEAKNGRPLTRADRGLLLGGSPTPPPPLLNSNEMGRGIAPRPSATAPSPSPAPCPHLAIADEDPLPAGSGQRGFERPQRPAPGRQPRPFAAPDFDGHSLRLAIHAHDRAGRLPRARVGRDPIRLGRRGNLRSAGRPGRRRRRARSRHREPQRPDNQPHFDRVLHRPLPVMVVGREQRPSPLPGSGR
jgi:peptidyl-prolyl cis-trans isomerase SurA